MWMLWQNEPSIGVNHRRDGEGGQGSYEVITHDAHLRPPCEHLIQKRRTKGLAACGFRRRTVQKGVGEQFLHKWLMHSAVCRSRAALIEGFTVSGQAGNDPSIGMLPGPVSKASTSASSPPAGRTVKLLMPPMLWTMRVRCASPNNR